MKLNNDNNMIEIPFIRKKTVEMKALKIISKGILISDNDINECRPLMINYCNLRVNNNELFETEDSWGEKMNKILHQDGEFSYQDREKVVQIINKNKLVFSDEPGLVKNFKGKLIVKEKTPFAPKTYPVPYLSLIHI